MQSNYVSLIQIFGHIELQVVYVPNENKTIYYNM